jgi:hypothetical protein
VVIFNCMIPQYRYLKNLGNYNFCHWRHEIKTCNSYCLSPLCPHQFNTACPPLACKVSVIAFFFPDDLTMTPYRCHPHKRPGSSGQTSLVAATSQSVHFACSIIIRFQAGQPHLHTCVFPLKWLGGERVCMLVAGTQDVTLYIRCPSCFYIHIFRNMTKAGLV